MNIDVIIPLYKPGKELFQLLDSLNEQSVPIQNIILMNTEEKYFQQLVYGSKFSEKYKNVKVYHLSKREFDHGKTRHMGVQRSRADVFVMMTQDAMPADSFLIEKLTQHLSDDVAVSYAMQLPTKDCSIVERYTRSFNYPQASCIKSAEDIPRLGIKTFFCSNVCAAYRRELYEELGGFIRHTIFNEDMIYAAGAIEAGYKIAYEAEAKVIHSHNYTHRQQFHRNFDLGVSQADHPEIFAGVPSESEGMKLVKRTTAYLKEKHRLDKVPYFYVQCACKYAGYLLGKHYRKLPKSWILAFTSNKEYWSTKF
ncbi:MAG: glycosyltransferase family 2 protein [Lachnospiraceae bacterium]|nr:glycosyltransferase family 2 protein [Lachnospiraceae bacterium]